MFPFGSQYVALSTECDGITAKKGPPKVAATNGACATPAWAMVIIALGGIAYFGVCVRLMWAEVLQFWRWAISLCQPPRATVEFRSSPLVENDDAPAGASVVQCTSPVRTSGSSQAPRGDQI